MGGVPLLGLVENVEYFPRANNMTEETRNIVPSRHHGETSRLKPGRNPAQRFVDLEQVGTARPHRPHPKADHTRRIDPHTTAGLTGPAAIKRGERIDRINSNWPYRQFFRMPVSR